jgi:hypothetical protein
MIPATSFQLQSSRKTNKDDEIAQKNPPVSASGLSTRTGDKRSSLNVPARTILDLPSEILRLVLRLHFYDAPPPCRNRLSPSDCQSISTCRLGWISVTHVCSYLRNIAIYDSFLWREIAFSLGPSWSSLMLARARRQPLVIESVANGEGENAMAQELATIRDHITHIESIDLIGSRLALLPLVEELSKPAPLLESISLSLPQNAKPGQGVIIPHFLAQSAPRLRRVSLHGCGFTWHAIRFAGLEHLSVTMPAPPPARAHHTLVTISQIPTYYELLGLLDLLKSSLRTLVLKYCIPRRLIARIPSPIDLARLEFASFAGPADDSITLLSDIALPLSADLHLACTDVHARSADLSGVVPFVRERLAALAEAGTFARTISLHAARGAFHAASETALWAAAYPSAEVSDPRAAHPRPFLRLNISDPSPHSASARHNDFARVLLQAMPLQELRTLMHSLLPRHGGASAWPTINAFQITVLNSPRLEDVQVSGAAAWPWALAMFRPDGPSSPTVRFEALRTVRVVGSDVDARLEVLNRVSVLRQIELCVWGCSFHERVPALREITFVGCSGVEPGAGPWGCDRDILVRVEE